MRSFVLEREEDVSGVSGVGTVAEGVQFTDGTVVLRWIVGAHHSTVVWPSIESVEVIHGHDGRTKILWQEQIQTSVRKKDAPWLEREDRTVHGYGVDDRGKYEVVRYAIPMKFFLEREDGSRRQISVREAVEKAQNAYVGLPGGGAFDRLWTEKAFG